MNTVFQWPGNLLLVNNSENILRDHIIYPFAYDEMACKKVGLGQTPMIHVWRHHKGFVLGMRDWKLPYSKQAVDWLKQQGYDVMVRHSGGAAVPLDAGVLNISIILPKPVGEINIHHDFEIMYQCMKNTMRDFSQHINKGEVVGSYCPGDYDLSIDGFKFCGIAQRRQTKSFIVHAFVVIEGSGSDRAALVRDFYNIASGDIQIEESKRAFNQVKQLEYPQVVPTSTASLSELTKLTSVQDFVNHLKKYISSEANIFEHSGIEMNSEIKEMMNRIESRYKE
ncbi:lipoate--protein ligase family protein [Chengkuizengella axinellae]|uniref:BPL/LPL catalytic domain-containing protein n=1 Tax=Chengkuizengella axinellae TaxID=3064388 RepID=A0ABT9IZ91_9BACL|nr:hypothetical protein [Chengkuizengella sp. 2205SS18-9]MDP5274690.1 hypothetical protein [Chengkuizengella sp. 2205SS18-9]